MCKKIFKRFISLLRKPVVFSAVIALIIVVISYYQDCCPYPLFDTLERYSWIQHLKKIDKPLPKDLLLVNTGNDQELVQTIQGNASIADRGKLSSFLQIADSCRNYKVILYDILFESEYTSENDSILGALLCRLPNVIIIRDVDIKGRVSTLQYENQLLDKTAFNSYYYPFFSSGFSRYQFIQEGKSSAALRMFELIEKQTINKHFLWFSSNRRLCKASPIITLSNNMRSYEPDGSVSITNCNIGKDYLEAYSKDSLGKLMQNKIIVIGDFDNDVHDSYVGKIPGSLIAVAAYDYLKSGKHQVTLYYLLLFILYFVMCFFIVSETSVNIHQKFHDKHKHVGLLILSFIGYSLILSIISVIIYYSCNVGISIMVPSLIFSIISKCQECGIKMCKK